MTKECPSVTAGGSAGCQCSALPSLASVLLAALWRGRALARGWRLGGESLGLCGQHRPGRDTSPAAEGMGWGGQDVSHACCPPPVVLSLGMSIPQLFSLQGAPSTSLLLPCLPRAEKPTAPSYKSPVEPSGQLFLSHPQAFLNATAMKLSRCLPCLIAGCSLSP